MRRFLFLQMGGIYGILYLYGVYAKPRIYFVRSRNLSVALERGNDMKKRLFSLLLVLTLCFTLLPYSVAAEGEEEMVTVTFDMCGHGGEAPASVTVPKGSKIAAPESRSRTTRTASITSPIGRRIPFPEPPWTPGTLTR